MATTALTAFPQKYRKPLAGFAVAVVLYALLGFFLAPWLVEKISIDAVQETLGTELSFDEVAINPFVLSLEINGLALDEPDGSPFLTIERIFVNFQLSSLFRWAFTFREFHIESPEVRLARDGDGNFNVAFLVQTSPEPEDTEEDSESGPVRLFIHDFAIRDNLIDWRDDVPPEPVVTRFGPVNIDIADLNTLPARPGMQDVLITTDTQGTLSWNGSLQFNPLFSEGHASVKGSHFPITSAYLKHEAGFDITDGEADVEFDYLINTLDDGTLNAEIRNFDLAFIDVVVRTFNEALGRAGEDREVLRLPRMSLSGGELDWPAMRAHADSFAIDDAAVELFRDANGALNVLPPEEPEATEAATEDPEAPAASDSEWTLSLTQFSINRFALHLEDQSVEPTANIGWQSLDVDVRDISNEPAASFPTTVQLGNGDGGTITVDGQVTALPGVEFDVALGINALALASGHPYLQALADVNFDSGALNADMRLTGDAGDPLRAEGDVEIVDFLITETDEGSRLGSWSSLRAENLVYSTAGESLEVSEVIFTEPYGDILIAEDGSINLGRVQKGETTGEEDTDGEDAAAEADEEVVVESTDDGLDVTIGRVIVNDASADFADLSLPLPFAAKIAALNGEMSTIATSSAEPSTVELEGDVDEFGEVQIGGTVTPLNPPANTDIAVAFRNVDMPKFSAYSIPFAGREIASGRLDLDLGYQIVEGELVGENRIVLRDFELGDKVDHPDALSLPLGLAVALLKDPDGRISLDVPVRGSVDDPEFKIGGVVAKALVNVLTKIVTSPFALLANLVGAEGDELAYLAFAPGRGDLSPPEREKVAKIAEALALRPQLVLQVGGVYEPDTDGAVLRSDMVDARIDERIELASDGDEDMYADRRREVIEQLFTESVTDADPALALSEVRAANTTVNESGESQFDELAFAEALRDRLVDMQPVTDADLLALAEARAQSVRQAILESNPDIAARVIAAEASAAESDDDGNIRMEVRISASEDLPPAPQEAPSPVASATFACADGPTVSVRFPDAGQLQLDDGAKVLTLMRVRSASGGRYAGDGVEFWEKGDEAMLTIGESRFECRKLVNG